MKSRSIHGCYRVNGYSHKVWWDDPADRSTRQILKAEDRKELDEYYDPEYNENVPGAFGEGMPRSKPEKRTPEEKARKRRENRAWRSWVKRYWEERNMRL